MLSHVLLHYLCRPPFILCKFRPIIIVLQRASDVHHIIDGTGTTEGFASRDMLDFALVSLLHRGNIH
jgi:hypothetical protein